MVDRIVKLGRVVIPATNTPVKGVGSILVPSPRWRYKGPTCIITLTYQVGRWGIGFAGDSAIVTELLSQPASDIWKEFGAAPLAKGVALTGLGAAANDVYDMEMWFKITGVADQGAIFTGCCQVPSVAAALEIISCSFS